MKRYNFLTLAVLVASTLVAQNAQAANYTIDSSHSVVQFTVKHLGISNVTGRFDRFDGTFEYDPKNVEASKVQAEIDTTSVNTNQAKRDKHLSSPDFFDIAKFPKMKFVSKSVKSTGDGKFDITGDLTIRDVTKSVVLSTEFTGSAKGPDGKDRAAFVADTKINRKEFGLKWNDLTEAGGVLVGDEVKIHLEIEAAAG